jgi:hypothetical protein
MLSSGGDLVASVGTHSGSVGISASGHAEKEGWLMLWNSLYRKWYSKYFIVKSNSIEYSTREEKVKHHHA